MVFTAGETAWAQPGRSLWVTIPVPLAGTRLLLRVGSSPSWQAGQIALRSPLPTPSDPSKGQLGPGVLGHGVHTSPESQRWGDLGSHQGLHVEYEETDGQGGEVTPSPIARW